MSVAWVGLAVSVVGAANGNATASRNAMVQGVQTEASNMDRESNNIISKAEGNLARWMQSENNNRRLNSAGKNFNAGQMMIARTKDAALLGSIENQIAEAEAAGAFAANSASKGVGGTSNDIIDLTMKLKNSRATVARDRQQSQLNYEQVQQVAGVIPQAIAGLDNTVNMTKLDYSRDVSYDNTPSMFSAIAGAIATNPNSKQLARDGTAAVGKFFNIGSSVNIGGGSVSSQ